MSVTLRDVILAVSYGDASLVGESAGYLILGAADAALSSHELASLDAITIDEEGSVRLRGPKVDDDDAELALRQLLGVLLKKVRIPSNNLERVASRQDSRGLQRLIAELEAALVPVNRRAARRTLARLCREAKKSADRQHAYAAVEEVVPRSAEAPSRVSAPAPETPAFAQPVAPDVNIPAPVAQVPARDVPPPDPRPVAPTPAPVQVASVTRAEQSVGAAPPRLSQRPTIPAQPQRHLLDAVAGNFGSQTPVDNELSTLAVESVLTHDPWDAAHEGARLGDDDFEVDIEDEFDEAPTQVFGGVQAVEEAPPPTNARRLASPPPRRRRHSVAARPPREIADEDCLIVMSASAPRQVKSDISDLLDKMRVEPMSTDSLYSGLKTLSRVELSPEAPPVFASSANDPER